MSPDPTSSTSASDTCTTTDVFRARCCSRLSLEVRSPRRSNGAMCGPACLTTRNQSEQHTRKERDDQRERQHHRVDRDLARGAADSRGQTRSSSRSAAKVRPSPRHSAQQPQQQAFDAAADARSGAIRRQARRGPPSSCWRPSASDEQEIRDVGACDEQHHPDRAHQHPQHIADIAHDVSLQRPQHW